MLVDIQYNNSISFSELGLSLEINPSHLTHKLMEEDGREMLRNMMYEKLDSILKVLINDYIHIENNVSKKNKESLIEGRQIKSLNDFAIFTRQIAPICFSFELELYYNKSSEKKQKAIDWAYSIIRYNNAYGYKEGLKTEIKL